MQLLAFADERSYEQDPDDLPFVPRIYSVLQHILETHLRDAPELEHQTGTFL